MSREHLNLTYVDGVWTGVDCGSKNGTKLDGLRAEAFALLPGAEIRIGGVTLIAESKRSNALRNFLCRILGWADAQARTVDVALRSIRNAAFGLGVLYLNASIDPVPIALALHRYVWGGNRPFVMCDPRRVDTDEPVRGVANRPTAMEAFIAAHCGTLCARSIRRPRDLGDVVRRLGPSTRVLMIIVDAAPRLRYTADAIVNPPIEVPPLQDRADELSRVLDEYAIDAANELLLPRDLFTDEDREWILEHAATSLSEIEKATQRLLALRGSPNSTSAAARLHIAQVSLSRWFGRRNPPASLAHKFHN